MKIRWTGVIFLIISISVLMFTAFDSSAIDAPIDRVHIEVDVPVNGISLKSTAVVHEFIDSKNMETINANTASEVVDVYWYKTTEPGKVLSKGYKAKLGESYYVTVVLKPKSGYGFIDDLHNKNNLINGESALGFVGTTPGGEKCWLFDSTLTTIPAAGGKPIVTIKNMVLSPYEGNPMEVLIEVTNATNVKYQWQITYGDGSGFSGVVDLDDNFAYRGTKTAHFKIHSYFGDKFDEELNFAKVRCKVTSDNGTVYTQEVWYTLLDRQVVNGFSLTGPETPVFGKAPSYKVDSDDSSKYYVKNVIWYGPKAADGTYPRMSGNTFKLGEYNCKIIVATNDGYKIDDSYYGKVNGKNYIIDTIQGKNQVPYGPDTYSVTVPFTVEKIPLHDVKVGIDIPVAGQLPAKGVSLTTGVSAVETEWYRMDDRGRYIVMTESETFEPDTTYRCSVHMKLNEGYVFASTAKPYVNEKEASFSLLKGDDFRWVEYKFITPKEDSISPVNPFTDVKDSDYFYDPVLWAVEKGITTGTTPTTFSPDASCTRAQAVTFIWREAGQPEPTGTSMPFADVAKGSYYEKAVLWAVEQGITSGTSGTTFSPEDTCTRAQIVTFLWRYNGKPEASASNPFTDVYIKDYYYGAVLWAVEKGITTGMTATEFAPQKDCTRAQIVTFLYRNSEGE